MLLYNIVDTLQKDNFYYSTHFQILKLLHYSLFLFHYTFSHNSYGCIVNTLKQTRSVVTILLFLYFK